MSVEDFRTYYNKISSDYRSAFNNKDLDKILSYWTTDSQLLLPDASSQNPKQGISLLLPNLESWRFTLVDAYVLTDSTDILTGIITCKQKDQDKEI